MKKFILIILMFILSFFSVNAEESTTAKTQLGLVKSVEYIDKDNANDLVQMSQIAEVQLLDSSKKRETVKVENIITGNPSYDINLKKGMKVFLHIEEDGLQYKYSIEGVYRANILITLTIIFCALLIYVGKSKGISSIVSIALTIVLIIYLLAPAIAIGLNPVFTSIAICLLSTAFTMYLVGGFNRKSSSAILGCFFSIIAASILSLLTVKLAYLTGFNGEEINFLYSIHPELDFIGITISAMILATLGAVMDVAISIASTINEIYTIDNTKTVRELFKSGMNVGRDIIGTMANTLILVYLGGSLPLILLASNIDLLKFINLNQVVTEISAAFIGSSAIVLCVPITAIIASELIKKQPREIDFQQIGD